MTAAQTSTPSGELLYGKYCASCHDQTSARIPTRDALRARSPSRILKTLDFGAMMSIAYPLRRDERKAVAEFLGQGAETPPPPKSAFCGRDRKILSGPVRDTWAGWSPDSSNA